MKVIGSSGSHWRVSRRWLPWRRRFRVDDLGVGGLAPTVDDDVVALLVGLFVLVFVLPFLALAFLVAVELLLLLLLLPVAALGRVVLVRQWRVEVKHERSLVWEGEAGTWSESRDLMRRIAADLRRGETTEFPWLKGYGIVLPSPEGGKSQRDRNARRRER